MKWYEITVNTTSEGTELIADAFFSLGCTGGVKIIDIKDVRDIIANNKMWDYIDENLLNDSGIAGVSGYASVDEKDRLLHELTEYLDAEGVPYGEINVTEIDDELWLETWKKYYRPIDAGRYVIVPKWLNHDDENKIKILMDPGMAFGTGEHESTKMCLMLMSETDFKDKSVIDVGTGSGILGIGAIKSGAKSCYMCDIDSIAVKAATENAKLNGVDKLVEIKLADLLSERDTSADIVLANLTAGILIRLSKGLSQHINKGGKLICSGIIRERKKEVIDEFLSSGFALNREIAMGEWDALEFLWT